MPLDADLPKSSPIIDKNIFDPILSSLFGDQWKIYPTAVVPWTRIKKWFDEGKYVPHPLQILNNLLIC